MKNKKREQELAEYMKRWRKHQQLLTRIRRG